MVKSVASNRKTRRARFASSRAARRAAPSLAIEPLEPRQFFTAAPTATFLQFVKGAGASRTFAILYDSTAPINRATLDNNDVRVTGPGLPGASATFLGSAKSRAGTGTVARYRIDGITTGGAYDIAINPGEILDTFGNGVPIGTVGGFLVGRKGRTVPRGPAAALAPSVQVVATNFGVATSPPVIDTSFGPIVQAINFGGPAYNVNGSTNVVVHFSSGYASSSATPLVLSSNPFTVQMDSVAGNDLYDATVGSDPVYGTEIYCGSNSTQTLTITGLDPSRQYRFQFLHGDERLGSYPYQPTTQTFQISTGTFATTSLAFNTTTADAYSDTFVIVAGTTSLTYEMPFGGTRGPSFSGMVVESAPGIAVQPTPPAQVKFLRSPIQLSSWSQTFDIAFDPVDAVGIAGQNILVNGPGGYASLATLLNVTPAQSGTGKICTYRIDGIDTSGHYSISAFGQPFATLNVVYLQPGNWIWDPPLGRKARHPRPAV